MSNKLRPSWLVPLLLLLLLLLGMSSICNYKLSPTTIGEGRRRPNIIFILADDLGMYIKYTEHIKFQ